MLSAVELFYKLWGKILRLTSLRRFIGVSETELLDNSELLHLFPTGSSLTHDSSGCQLSSTPGWSSRPGWQSSSQPGQGLDCRAHPAEEQPWEKRIKENRCKREKGGRWSHHCCQILVLPRDYILPRLHRFFRTIWATLQPEEALWDGRRAPERLDFSQGHSQNRRDGPAGVVITSDPVIDDWEGFVSLDTACLIYSVPVRKKSSFIVMTFLSGALNVNFADHAYLGRTAYF